MTTKLLEDHAYVEGLEKGIALAELGLAMARKRAAEKAAQEVASAKALRAIEG
jgi:hypothetical protein